MWRCSAASRGGYVTGAESKSQTGEPHAVEGEALPQDMQGFTYCFAMDYIEGEDHTIERPERYDFWRKYKADFWPDRLLSWSGVRPHTLEHVSYELFEGTEKYPLFYYRRIIDSRNFEQGFYPGSITLVNWPQNDYWLGSVIDVSDEEKEQNLWDAKQLSLSLLYWLQTEAPRPDGGSGYPGLRLRKDIVGTEDGLAMSPYMRESRRIKAEFTVLEQHVSTACRPDGKAEQFADSVGIGCYRIDLHPSTGNRHYIDVSSLPFQIPLGSLIPVRMNNLLPACKNLASRTLQTAAIGSIRLNGTSARLLDFWQAAVSTANSCPARYAAWSPSFETSIICLSAMGLNSLGQRFIRYKNNHSRDEEFFK